MRLLLCSLVLGIVPLISAAEHDPLEVNTHPPPEKVKLRGKRNVDAVHKRVIRPTAKVEAIHGEDSVHLDPLVEPHHSIAEHTKGHRITLRGTSNSGHAREVTVNLEKVEPHLSSKSMLLHNNHKHGHYSHQHAYHERGYEYHGDAHHHHSATGNPEAQNKKEGSVESKTTKSERTKSNEAEKRESIQVVKIPSSRSDGFNETLFDWLHNAPFDIYEKSMGHKLDEDEPFPVFTMPTWYNVTGVFSAFSKAATPLIFENAQVLLGWDNMLEASNGASESLMEIIEESNFHASLIVGKSFGFSGVSSFLGLVTSYYQFGVQKHVLVPFARVEDFFDDSSDYSDPTTKDLEMAALHDLLAQKKSNSTNPHPVLELRDARIDELENLEAIRFQKLFQALIRRSFLFSFGYADCLGSSPYHLRECLDDVYLNLVKQETNVRGALDKELATHMAQINESFHSHVREACIMVQGEIGGPGFGSGSCYDLSDLRSFVQSTLY